MKLDSEIKKNSSSIPVLPKIKPPAVKLPKTLSKSSFEEQQERLLKIKQEKMPIGRDGKRLPLPFVSKKPKNPKKTESLYKSGELKR